MSILEIIFAFRFIFFKGGGIIITDIINKGMSVKFFVISLMNIWKSLNVSGAAALSGECISGHHKSGKYYFTNNKEELAYYSERAKCILEKASPLMEIYREETQGGLNAFFDSRCRYKRQ